MNELRVVVMPGDGIGHEVMDAALAALAMLERRFGFSLAKERHEGGAGYYRDHGKELPDGTLEACRAADAILFGAIGLPEVRKADGTEIAPHLRMRAEFELIGGVRPVRRLPNTPCPLAAPEAANIDFVILRESTEGLFHSVGKGVVVDGRYAEDTLRITRSVCETLFAMAFELARQRKAAGRGRGVVACVDKANVFRSYAFFREIFDEVAAGYPDIATERRYVDATALELVRRPWIFDVIVIENMFGDILSDLGGGLVGGMGMAPCAELGKEHALFQPAHGTAPDIAGQDKANPTAMLLSTAMMLEWLARRHDQPRLAEAAQALDDAVVRTFADRAVLPCEFGGPDGTRAVTEAVLERLA